MVCLTVGNGSTGLTHFQQLVAMVLLAILMAMVCRTYRNIPTSNLQIGTTPLQPAFLTTVFGGTVPSLSTTGTKRIRCSSTNPSAVIQEATVKATPFSVMKTLLETYVPMGLTTIRMAKSMALILTTTEMQIVPPMTMTVTVSLTKIPTVGTRTVTVCPMGGKLQTA